MKIKSLLVAGLALLAVSATAETFNVESKITLPEDFTLAAGETSGLTTMTLNRVGDNTDNFTNAQLNILPLEGLEIVGVTQASPVEATYYNELEEADKPALGIKNAFNAEINAYVIGFVNETYNEDQIKIEKNPVALCRIKIKLAEDFAGGDWKAYLKYTDYANNDFVNEEYVLFSFPTETPPEVAVENINAGKAVAGVKYYNVAGQAADSAFEGVNIVVTTYADGTQNVVKVVK